MKILIAKSCLLIAEASHFFLITSLSGSILEDFQDYTNHTSHFPDQQQDRQHNNIIQQLQLTMNVLLQHQTPNALGLESMAKESRKRKCPRMSEETSGDTSTHQSSEAPTRKRFTGTIVRKYAAQLALLDSISIDLSPSDCPFL